MLLCDDVMFNNKARESASSIYLQPLTTSTATCCLKYCLPASVSLTLLSSGFSPISLFALFPLKHRKHHALFNVVFRNVQFFVPSCSSSTLIRSVHSSKHPQLTISYRPTLLTANYYSSLCLQAAEHLQPLELNT